MAYCTPYLLKLGLTKSHVSLVWVAGPLSGLIMQPLVGIVADRSHSRFGRRRPYMVIGTVIACLSLMVLGWTPEIVGMFISDKKKAEPWTLLLAVLGIYGIDFSINAVQASARSLIVDTLPSSKQQVGSAWATRMVATGCVLGYAAGSIDLTRVFGSSIGDTQFQQLIVVAVTFLCLTVSVTCWAVEERVLVSTDDIDSDFKIKDVVLSIARKAVSLPSRVSTVCWIQFWFWVGWFPFLFYSTTWIGEVYMRFNASAEAKDHPDSLAQIGRVGSTSLVIFAVVTLISSIIFPIVVVGTPDEADNDFTPRPLPAIANILHKVYKHRPSLLSTWTCSHIIFAGAMICTPFVTSLRAATILVALCGM
jgi:solute carrier family 45, member 1/2/4